MSMQRLLLLGVAFIAVASATIVQYVPVDGILVGPVTDFAATPPACTKFGFECTPDCRTFMVCAQIGQPGGITDRCAAATPYCVNNACVATPNANNAQCTAAVASFPFVCTAAGLFPDPYSCTQYYSCSAAAPAVPIQFRCPTGSTYDARVASCVAKTIVRRSMELSRTFAPKPACTTTMCRRGFTGTVAYTPYPAMYVRCEANGARTVFRCNDVQNQVYDAKLGVCVFRCVAAGQFVDREDCRRFYTCTKRGSKYTVVRETCQERFWFAGTRCERDGATACVPEIA